MHHDNTHPDIQCAASVPFTVPLFKILKDFQSEATIRRKSWYVNIYYL